VVSTNDIFICSLCIFKKGLSPSVHEVETATTITWKLVDTFS
jgi:hypothetical protein